MNRNGWMVATLVCVAAAGVAAAQGETNTTVTVTGCVQNISSSSPGGGTSRGFLLSNATLGDDANAETAATRRPASTSTASFLLDGHDGDLKAHVGHKVEVTGTVDAPVETTSEPRAPGAPASAGAKSMDQQQRLHVSAVKMIASNCLSK
jgi:hypothetical protein